MFRAGGALVSVERGQKYLITKAYNFFLPNTWKFAHKVFPLRGRSVKGQLPADDRDELACPPSQRNLWELASTQM